MAGSDDGSVQIWKNYNGTISRDPILLTAWQALADVQPATKTSSGTYQKTFNTYKFISKLAKIYFNNNLYFFKNSFIFNTTVNNI